MSPIGQSPTQNSMMAAIELFIHSVMEGVRDAKITIPVDATVFELKRLVHLATDVIPERQLLLFKDKELSAAEVMVFMPMRMPFGNSSLRNTIRTMTNVMDRRPKKIENTVIDAAAWTPAKQMEHEITRNRMKNRFIFKSVEPSRKEVMKSHEINYDCEQIYFTEHPLWSSSVFRIWLQKLLRLRKRTPASKTSSPQGIYTPGSVASRSPSGTMSPVETADNAAQISRGRTAKIEDLELTEKDLKVKELFFEPAESIDELYRTQQEICLPPETVADLLKFKKEKEEREKTMCKICRCKLPLSEQQIICHCQFVFCRKHREPSAHLCQIDYKQTGRRKIRKENPKVDSRGIYKAQMLD
ncbi:AN1-like Zinc finger [Dictyocaulus viviparus]|uniref:AN1-like Zinc finger n=1 Tax=Dictyocaulus viviparus TaxID=29172 RepID=A0A0D8XN48_DICVI|nr:AN1-like Zinc finger [Dictyocaulus viviparus]